MAENGVIQTMVEQSAQSRFKSDTGVSNGISVLSGLIMAGELLPPWWSPRRDIELSRWFMQSDAFQAAAYRVTSKLLAVQLKVVPRNSNIKSSIALADEYDTILYENWELGQGWQAGFEKDLTDLFTQDNGFFREITGDGPKDQPIIGQPTGSISLDSQRCTRTGNPIYPVVYQDTDGRRYKFHRSRIMFSAQAASTRSNKNGVGRCWITRAVNKAQNLVDIFLYDQEKLGSRPLRQMLIGKGITAEQLWGAILDAEEGMDNAGLRRYGRTVAIGSQSTDIDVVQRDLASIPDGFDEKTMVELGMYMIALAIGIPPRDLWPATATGATKADAETQHISGSAGYQAILDMFSFLIGGSPLGSKQNIRGKFLPPTLKLVFDFVDDEADSRHAQNGSVRAQTRERDINDGVINIRVARELALEAGDINQTQFEELELADSRLPDGTSVLNLFLSTDRGVQQLLDISTPNPLDVEANLENADFILRQIKDALLLAQVQAVNASTARLKDQAKQAVRALTELERIYQEETKPRQPAQTEIPNENPITEGNADIQEEKAIDFTPPQDVQAAARRGLELRKKYGRGGLDRSEAATQGIGSGVQRATNLANGDKVSPETINRMVSFFARHEGNKSSKTDNGEPGAGMIAWLLWGGDPGQRWANKLKRQMEASKKKGIEGLTEQDIISFAPLDAQAANYRKANKLDLTNRHRCDGCAFNRADNICDLYKFKTTRGYTCDRYENRTTSALIRRHNANIRLR